MSYNKQNGTNQTRKLYGSDSLHWPVTLYVEEKVTLQRLKGYI